MVDFDRVSRELLRALRGTRSQTAFSRRLGFRSNVSAKWESGQRMPTAVEAFQYSQVLGVDVPALLRRFQPNIDVGAVFAAPGPQLHRWLSALRGAQRLGELAQKSGLSRYSVGRFLTGQSEPRLPQFLALVEALTARVDELIDLWVGIERVGELEPRFLRVQAARRAMTQRPLCLAVMCLLDTTPLRARGQVDQEHELARVLERPIEELRECLELLLAGGVIALDEGRYQPVSQLTVDAHTSRARQHELQGYWGEVAARHALAPNADDVCSYNVFSIARRDYEALRELQRDFYRTARALIAASEPTELAGLLFVQMVAWAPAASS